MSGLSYNQARWALGQQGMGFFQSSMTDARCPVQNPGNPGFFGIGATPPTTNVDRPVALRNFEEILGKVKGLSEQVSDLRSKVTAIHRDVEELSFNPAFVLLERKHAEETGGFSAGASGPRQQLNAMLSRTQEGLSLVSEAEDAVEAAKRKIRDVDEAAGSRGWGCFWAPSSPDHVSQVISPARSAIDEARSAIERAKRDADPAGLQRQADALKRDLNVKFEELKKEQEARQAREAEIAAAQAEAAAAAAALKAEQDAAAAAAAAEAQAQSQAAAQASAAQIEAQTQAMVAKQQIELQRLEMELQVEQQKLNFELERLAREEERAAAREEREMQKEELLFQMQMAKSGLAPPPTYAGGGMWSPQAGSAEFAFSPAAAAPAAPAWGAWSPAAPAQAYAPQVQAPLPVSQPQAVPASPPPPPPVVAPAQAGPFLFDQSWSAPTGTLFGMRGMSGLVRVLNPNLPSGSRVESGYKIHGPDASGQLTVERPDGSTFPISMAQAKRSGARIIDPKTNKVFYEAGKDTSVTVEDASSIIQAIAGAVGSAAAGVTSIYQDVTGTKPQQPDVPQDMALSVSKTPAWLPWAFIGVGGLVAVAWLKGKK